MFLLFITLNKEIEHITSWSEYWVIFDKLINLLKSDNKINIVEEFLDAQRFVNGMTDGWFEFKFAFEKSLNLFRVFMTEEQNNIADFLLATLNKSLIK